MDERECAMGFCMSTIVVLNLSKGTQRWILGQVMHLQMHPMDLKFGFGIIKTFCLVMPTHLLTHLCT